MSDDEETQETPAGATIPIPDKQDVFRDLEKVARSPKRARNGAKREDQSPD
ncbi:MAG: hypothetical protein WAM97_15060 [Acidimicrobiales bacterium]